MNNVRKEQSRLARMEQNPRFTQKFTVTNVSSGWTPELGGCLVIQCQNAEHELEVWYSPQGKTANDSGYIHICSRNSEEDHDGNQ